jgi:chromosome segregation ATPase
MKLRAVKKNDDAREKVRELFEARDLAKAARTELEGRVERLTGKLKELESSLPGLRKSIKDREYDWRMAQAKLEVHESSQEDVDAAEKAIDDARAALEEAEGKIGATEDLIAEAQNRLPSLKIAEEAAARRPWAAISEQMGPDVREAAATIGRFYVAELNGSTFGISADIFLRRVVFLGDVANIARQLEEEYRK